MNGSLDSESYVQWCKLKSKGKRLFQWEVWSNCRWTSRFCCKPAMFCYCDGSSLVECRIGYPWKFLYADNLVIMSGNLENLKIQLQAWRTSLDNLVLRINVGKANVLGSSGEPQKPTASVKWPCSMRSKGVGVNSTLCQTCNLWTHQRWTGVKGTLKKERMCRCKSVKVKVFHLTVWIPPKYMSVKTHSKLGQLHSNLVTSLENRVVV